MKKTLLLSIICALLLAVLASPQVSAAALVDKPTPNTTPSSKAGDDKEEATRGKKGKPEHIRGTLAEVNGSSLTVKLADGSQVKVILAAATRIKIPAMKNASLKELEKGVTIMVLARKDQNGKLVAQKIQIVPGKPARFHRVGVVTAYKAGDSITIQDKDGQTVKFLLDKNAKILPASRAGELAKGARVTIISRRNPAGGPLTAQGVVVHPKAGDKEDD